MVLAATVAGSLWFLMRDRETGPVIDGKPLSVWLHSYQRASPYAKTRAQEVVRAAGTNAVPTLLRMLRERDSAAKLNLLQLAKLQHFFRVRSSLAADRNMEASLGFAVLGPEAKDAVPALVEIYEQNISPPSVYWTAISLANIGPAASNAIPALVRGLTNPSSDQRLGTLTALAEIHSMPEQTVPALMTALNDQQAMVRYYAVLALSRCGAEATNALPALTALAKDPDRNVRGAALDCLQKLKR